MQPDLMERLRAHWRSHGVTPNRGTAPQDIGRFEKRCGVKLPPDLDRYFRELNGVDADAPPPPTSPYRFADKDDQGFAFWPLDRVTRASEGEAPLAFQGAASHFVFADHMDWSWAYAIRLSDRLDQPNPVVIIGTLSRDPQPLAASFTEFVELYLAGPEHIWVRS